MCDIASFAKLYGISYAFYHKEKMVRVRPPHLLVAVSTPGGRGEAEGGKEREERVMCVRYNSIVHIVLCRTDSMDYTSLGSSPGSRRRAN